MSALQKLLANKTDKELLYYVHHPDKHTAEAVQLALAELQKRNVDIPESLSNQLDQQLEQNETDRKTNNLGWRKNIVDDIEAPRLYSQIAIYVFSICFTVFFGSFLMASNSKDVGKPAWPVIVFGLLYTVILFIVVDYFSLGGSHTVIANSLGVVVMYELFWKRYIGKDTKYRAKPIWIPLIIGLAIFIPYFLILMRTAGDR